MCIRDSHSIKQVALVKEKVNRSGQEEPSLLQAEMEEELAEEIQISVTTKEVIGKPTVGVETKLLLVPEPVSYTHLDVYKRQLYHITVTMGTEKQCCRTNNSRVQESRNDLSNQRIKTEDRSVTTVGLSLIHISFWVLLMSYGWPVSSVRHI